MTDESFFCLHVTKGDGYFHVVCQSEITLSGVLKGWSRLAERCLAEGVNKIICQPHVPGPTEFLDVYQFGMSFRDIAWPAGMRIAVVCGTEELGRYQIAETMVKNLRGPESGIFTTVEDARNWLFGKP